MHIPKLSMNASGVESHNDFEWRTNVTGGLPAHCWGRIFAKSSVIDVEVSGSFRSIGGMGAGAGWVSELDPNNLGKLNSFWTSSGGRCSALSCNINTCRQTRRKELATKDVG